MDQKDEAALAFKHAAEEMRFFKSQQWLITNYALLLQAAIVGALKLIADLQRTCWLPISATISVFLAVASVTLLCGFQAAIDKERSRMDAARSDLPRLEEIHQRKLSIVARKGPFVVLIIVNAIACVLAMAVLFQSAPR